jgi:hypothetical protein
MDRCIEKETELSAKGHRIITKTSPASLLGDLGRKKKSLKNCGEA